MASRHAHPCPRQRRAVERGFTMVELLVVMVIAIILMSLGVLGVMSARDSGRSLSASAVAQAYADAADAFAREHEGRYPNAPGQANADGTIDWLDGNDAMLGPKSDILGKRKFYLRHVPEAVQDGRVRFGTSGDARVTYEVTGGGSGYVLTLTVRGRPECVINGGAQPDSGTNRCSKR